MNQKYKPIVICLLALPTSLGVMAQGEEDNLDSIASKVNVAFKTVDKSDLMGGISMVDMVDLTSKNYNTYSLNNLQAHVGGYNGQLWNQGSALVLVDGVPRSANNVNPSEIEQITFLKSASAVVLYGSRAAYGAILITTKRGHTDGLKINVRGNASLFVPKSYPKYLNSASYMTLYNEALQNDGKSPIYSDEDIYNYASGKNPYRYPNINFFSDEYLKKSYQRYEGTAEIEGGGKLAHFYTNIGLYHTNDLINFGEGKNNGITRLNIRGNVDLNLGDWIKGWVNGNATFYDASSDNSTFWSSSATLRPTSEYPLTPLIPLSYIEGNDLTSQSYISNSNYIVDGKYLLGGTQSLQTNPFAAMYAGGYNKYTSRQLQFDAGVKMNLSSILRGLSFKTQVGVDYATTYSASINNKYSVYEPSWNNYSGEDLVTSLTKYGRDVQDATQTLGGSTFQQTIMFSGQFDYNRSFNDHNLSASLLAHGYQITTSGEYHRTSNANLGLNVNYNYQQKYYADLSAAVVHSAKLAEGHREALSPVATFAWRLSKEKFMEDAKWIDDLKLNASYGVVNQDLDISSYYMYSGIFTATGTWWGWSESANSMQTSDSQRGENKELSFIARKEFRVGLDASLLGGMFKVNANFYNIHTNGYITTPSTIMPSYLYTYYPVSSFLSYMNYNNTASTGFDFAVDFNKKIGEVDLTVGVTGMANETKYTRYNENVEYDWLKTEGKRTDSYWGYECLGFFNSADEVANSATINSTTKPGDLKYKDQNGDGKIDSKDRIVIGHWSPDFYLGLNLTAKWRNFTLYLNGTGNFGGTGIKSSTYDWVYGSGKYSEVVLGRWTPETAATATYPRLTTEGSELNFVNSTFWTYSTDAFRLNKVQLTYDFPAAMFADKFVKGLSVYVSGSDLLTIGKERKYLEMNVGTTPQTRAFNLGFNVKF